MKKALCTLLATLLLTLPSLTLAEEIQLLWGIPFSQSAAQFAQDAERIKGIKMDTTPFKPIIQGRDKVQEKAISIKGQDLQLFGIPFTLEYRHTRRELESGLGETTGEYVTVSFSYFYKPENYRTGADPHLTPSQALESGLEQTRAIWNELVAKYGKPSYASIDFTSDYSAWSDGTAPYVSETKVLSQPDIQKLLEDPPSFIRASWEEYPYPSQGGSIWVKLFIGNVSAQAHYAVHTNGSFIYRNDVDYNRIIYDEPKPSLYEKEQKQSYSDTGL